MRFRNYRLLLTCLLVLSGLASYPSLNAAPPTGHSSLQVTYLDSNGTEQTTTAYDANGTQIQQAAYWAYHPMHGVPACNGGHTTADGNAFQHGHTSHWSFPVYTVGGQAVTAAMVEAYWRKVFDVRYGKNEYTEEGNANPSHNCHSYALGTTNLWNDLSDSFLVDGYDQTLQHSEAVYYGLVNGNYGNYIHSLKKDSYVEIGSGTWKLVTKEKYRDSQIFVKEWQINSDDDPPGGVNGSGLFTGHKWKPE